jgi:methionyl-tRNA synthetase
MSGQSEDTENNLKNAKKHQTHSHLHRVVDGTEFKNISIDPSDALKFPSNKSFIITSALPYANGEIHLGHIASTYLPADIFARFLKLNGNKVAHVCATDDFGTPILIRAEKSGKNPSEYVREWNIKDKNDFESVGITFDFFSKTSSEANIKFVQEVFIKLYKNNFIYEENVIQYFCTVDKKFLPDRYVVGTCPFCNAENQYSDLCESCGRVPEVIKDPKCLLCGNSPIKKDSTHYFFKLSEFGEKLNKWLTENPDLQTDVVNYVLSWVNSGLQDWDITRDLTWGVPIPKIGSNDEFKNKVFYGWFDNHLCYISAFKEYCEKSTKEDGKKLWNNSQVIHFIGKDIVYHHYLFLPAIRMGINYEYKLPDKIVTRGHLLFQNKKLSKSKNWSISLNGFTQTFNKDYLRFYLSSIIPYSQSDINFDWDTFYEKINNELIANIGNFVNRTLSFTLKQFSGIVPECATFDELDLKAIDLLKQTPSEIGHLIYNNHIDKAMKKILQFSSLFNQYFQNKEPWKFSTNSHNTIFISVNGVRALSILLYPFIPDSASKIWTQLGYSDKITEHKWNSAGELLIGGKHKINSNITPIFLKLERAEIDKMKNGFK